MPLPWGVEMPEFPIQQRIERPKDKAMTLRNLRDLRQFLQRLCKCGLLLYPRSLYNDRLGRSEKRIKWTQINQHDIVATVVKKIIPEKQSCSWVEMVSHGRVQPVRFFCSHNWSEPFSDFMASIDHHSRQNRIGAQDAYWICTYANDQWHVELGFHLVDSPFYEALTSAEMTMLMLDKAAAALERTWVVFEMTETFNLKKSLQAWTALGQVGSAQVATGPFVEALQNLRTSHAQASNPCDQRQIMNHIVGVDEMSGILMNGDGRKELDPKQPIDTYERQLLEDHIEKFLQWDKDLCQVATSHLGRTDDRTHRIGEIPNLVARGITLAQLRALKQEFEGWLGGFKTHAHERSGAGCSFLAEEEATLEELKDCFIQRCTRERQCSYVELIADSEQLPEYHVTCTWTTSFASFMKAIEWHAEAREVPDATSYWIDLFALNLHLEGNCSSLGSCWPDYDDAVSKVLRQQVTGVVLVLDDEGRVLTLGSNLYEMHLAVECSRQVDLLASSGIIATTRPFPDGTWIHGDFDYELASSVLEFDVLNAEFLNERKRNKVLNSIATDSERSDPDKMLYPTCWEYALFNQRLRHHFAGPVLREAAYQGDMASILKVVAYCPLIELDSPQLQGDLGEKAIHCAAARGHLEVLEHLLSLEANVNTQDLEGETPLHYAAFTGQHEAVQLLLRHGANPARESFSAEWPYEVAEQNPAYFVGVRTTEVLQELRSAMKSRAVESKRALGLLSAADDSSYASARQVFDEHTQKVGNKMSLEHLKQLLQMLKFDDLEKVLEQLPRDGDDSISIHDFLCWLYPHKEVNDQPV